MNPIDQYISTFPSDVQSRLKDVRNLIQKLAPTATEAISYGMPTFKLNGNLIHFAGYKNHIGLYPTPSGIDAFKKELSVYKNAKGSVQFPHTKPLPLDLISKIVKYRVAQNLKKKWPHLQKKFILLSKRSQVEKP